MEQEALVTIAARISSILINIPPEHRDHIIELAKVMTRMLNQKSFVQVETANKAYIKPTREGINRRKFTEEEDKFIRDMWSSESVSSIAKALDRPKSSIHNHAIISLGLARKGMHE